MNEQNMQTEQNNRQKSVLQDWVMWLPLRHQGVLLTAVRGCDDEPKFWTSRGVSYSSGRRLTAFIRWCFMNPADIREVDYAEGSFFRSFPPENFKPSEYGHLPQHWYSHVMHALEVIGYKHPNLETKHMAHKMYIELVLNQHLRPESEEEMDTRLTEDRFIARTVVS